MEVPDQGLIDVSEEEDPRSKRFSVTNPIKIGGHIKYTV